MMRKISIAVLLIVSGWVVIVSGCYRNHSPVTISPQNELSGPASCQDGARPQTHLWGYFQVFINPHEKSVEYIPLRHSMFSVNVVNILNGGKTSMGFKINNVDIQAEFTDIDIDVSLTHPFPGLPQYNGYDVRGVFIGDGSASMNYNSDLVYPVFGTDQYMFRDAVDGLGGPDGYTRWFNPMEFSSGGMALFQYTHGKLATPGYKGTSTLNPYSYFADGLKKTDDLWNWLIANGTQHGVFSSGMTNTRNYYLRFPSAKKVTYGYAVIANWQGVESQHHPSNAPEAVGCRIEDNSNVFYVDSSIKGGKVKLDISIFDWDSALSAGKMEDYRIYIESEVINSVYELSLTEMVPIGGGEHYSTYRVEIPANPSGSGITRNNWVIVEDQSHDYTNEFGVSNLADTDPLAAYFRFDLNVSPNATSSDPICNLSVVTSMPAENWSPVPVEFDASGSYDPDGDPLTFAWDFDGDGVFGENPDDSYKGTMQKPVHGYLTSYNGKASVKVKDDKGGEAVCSVDVQVIARPSKNLPLHQTLYCNDIAIDHTNGDLIALLSDGVGGLGNPADQVWRYSRTSWYTSGTKMYDLYWGSPDGYAIDMASDKVSVLAAKHIAGVYNTQIWGADNVMLCAVQQGGTNTPTLDVYAVCAGVHKDDVGNILAWPDNNATFAIRYPKGNYFFGHYWYYYYPTVYTGYNQIYWEYIKAVESDMTANCIWYLEDAPEYYVSRWKLVNTYAGYGDQVYDNAYFGTGSKTDADNGWNNSKDISRDNQNRYFVLDQLSNNAPRIKMWTVSGNTTTSKGGFGDSSTISGAPKKIEGSDFNGDVVVLHGTTLPNLISVFVPFEMPD